MLKRIFRTAALSLPLIMVVAAGFRADFAWRYEQPRPKQALAVIPFLFESGNIAESLATGRGFGSPFRVETGPTAWMTPIYPFLLSWILRAFGINTFRSWVAAVTLNIVFSTLTCVPIFFAGKRVGGTALGAGAAWLWAIFPNAILLSYQSLWDGSISAFLAACILVATLALADSSSARDWCAYGLLWGVAIMTNAVLGGLFPLLLGWAALRARVREGGWIRNAGLATAVAIACCIPWTVRNYEVFDTFVPLRSTLGLQLYSGNNENAKVVWLGEGHPIYDSAEREKYVEMGEIAYMHEKLVTAVGWMVANPGRDARLVAGRFVGFWAGGSIHPVGDFIQNHSAWFRYVLLFNILAGLGALAGIFVLWKGGSPFAFPAAAYVMVMPWAYYLTLVFPRYRLPVDPAVLLLAAAAIEWVFRNAYGEKGQTG
jgi:4-amino-4-deoxy-L-arabinose transferase-like glycosyltransferase